ncbi:fatty acyl-CoA hydrolase precursor, medium chain [Lingula anatina]|uniref:Fatty acyl-CoA hydrolase precursor, medium chain n=1 Tax=Lingula anatina TaxID=7574 RepID=A0A1S3JK56_LINAN|nr:fatty acyl-CoA hydrolase precursor, medium chain [Lingula anatina]|eukprot:XP_013410805.1 fatty acyl-CoA hydrolase precursor, medium chain [Lingula anatina]
MASNKVLFAASFYILVQIQVVLCTDTPVVLTNLGQIVGDRAKVDTGPSTGIVDRFLGIPYAKPPVGTLRFANPERHPGWGESIRQVKQFGPHCLQQNSSINLYINLGRTITNLTRAEDCLFLNVFVPRGVDLLREKGVRLAILVHFHAGTFVAGTGATFNGDILALESDVVLVTFNYRLGFLGFFSTGTDEARGNYGLYDQHWAIKWVRENAEAFGGDPDRITLIGDAAGGALVDYQMISPLNRGLIQGGISMSGSSLTPGYLAESLNVSLEFSKLAGCDMPEPSERLRCLRNKDAQELAEIRKEGLPGGLDWRPSIDGVLVPRHPRELLGENVTSGLRYMVGSSSHDGSFLTYSLIGDPPTVSQQRLNLETFASMLYQFKVKSAGRAVARSLFHEYGLIQDPMDPLDILTQKVQQNTDIFFGMPAEESARLNAAAGATTYKYTLSVRLGYPSSYLPKADFVQAEQFDTRILYFGVFEQHPDVYNLTAEELELGRTIRRYIANFVKNGDPNVGDTVSVQWPQYTASSRQFINLDTPTTVETFDRERQYLFATEVLPAIVAVGQEADRVAARPCQPEP